MATTDIVAQLCPILLNPRTSPQAPLSMGFSGQNAGEFYFLFQEFQTQGSAGSPAFPSAIREALPPATGKSESRYQALQV